MAPVRYSAEVVELVEEALRLALTLLERMLVVLVVVGLVARATIILVEELLVYLTAILTMLLLPAQPVALLGLGSTESAA